MDKENWIKFYHQYRLYIFPAVVAFSCLILIALVMIPQVSKIVENSHVEADFKAKSDFLSTKVEALESYDEVDLSRKVSYVLSSFPAEKDFANVITQLQKLTSDNGFSIVSLSVGAGSGGASTEQSYGIKMETIGPKSLLAGFLNSVEGSPRLMRINHIDITSVKVSDVVSAALGIEVFFSPIPSNLGTIDSPLPEVSTGEEQLISRLARTQVLPSSSVSLTPKGKIDPFE